MTTEDTTNRRPIETLTAGEHVSDNQGVHEIVHVLSTQDGGAREITLTLRPLGPGRPWLMRHREGAPVRMATSEEIRECGDDLGKREALAEALRLLADDIVEHRLPLSGYRFTVSAGHLDSQAEVERWAVYLGVEVGRSGASKGIAVANSSRPIAERLSFDVHAQGNADPEPAPVEVVELSGAEWDAACRAGLARLGLTYAQLAEQARTGRLRDPEAIKLWPTVKGRPELDLPADPQPDACPCVEQPEAEQEWLFTFGSGQVHDGRFVRITGTWASARSRMNLIFGHAWCDQYTWASFDAAGLPGRVTELPEAEWPAHADDPTGLGHDRAEVEDEPSGGPVPAGVDGLAVSGRSVPDGAR
ncbi:hypothetical protein [Micromonospora tulbaghiae]|nr:hypothetical protein [Micromonospora tulbaghiae]